jgi:hypothetical protein
MDFEPAFKKQSSLRKILVMKLENLLSDAPHKVEMSSEDDVQKC